MKIAFISYEYPPDTADGGIATYTQQAAEMLVERGHSVEVFAGSRQSAGSSLQNGVQVHRIYEEKPWEFSQSVAQTFVQRHLEIGFDVLESPEYFAASREALRLAPDVPLVIKLHTPTYMMRWLESKLFTPQVYLRHLAKGMRRGTGPTWHPRHPAGAAERLHTLEADEITAPSLAIARRVAKDWKLPQDKVCHIPNVYEPSRDLLDIPVATSTKRVTYLGRLEYRKGVMDFTHAIPLVLKALPDLQFRFIGRYTRVPHASMPMLQDLKRILGTSASSVEFTGPRPLTEIPSLLAETDICVFPSLWENFPYVCLEAMAAARGVIGSRSGGMVEQLNHGQAGRLISPKNPSEIAAEIIFLTSNPEERQRLGLAARMRILDVYNKNRIGQLHEESYQRAIERRGRREGAISRSFPANTSASNAKP